MPTPTYTPIWSTTLAANASSVSISGIPQTFRDIVLICNYTGTVNGETSLIRLNGDSGANYTMVGMRGNGSAVGSYTTSTSYGFFAYAGGTTGVLESSVNNFLDYAANDKHKTWLVRSDNADSKTEAMANRWASTSAITSITLFMGSGSLASGSTFSLYGIAG